MPSSDSSSSGNGTGIFGVILQGLGSLLSRQAGGADLATNLNGTDQTIYLPSILR